MHASDSRPSLPARPAAGALIPAVTPGHRTLPGGGGGRIRTFEGISRQIYSLLPLAAWVPLRQMSRVFSGPDRDVSMSNGVRRSNFRAPDGVRAAIGGRGGARRAGRGADGRFRHLI